MVPGWVCVRVCVILGLLAIISVRPSISSGGVSSANSALNTSNTSCQIHRQVGIRVVSLRWFEVGAYFTVTAFVIVAGFTKLAFHHFHWLSSKIPESCILVLLGMALGLIVYFTNKNQTGTSAGCDTVALPSFTSDMFFFILLPPIVLESAYSLHDRAFFDNLGTVLVFALVGTLFNIATIGPTLYGINVAGGLGSPVNFTFTEGLVFSSLISAVDPVAVLVIFQELGVNKDLYFLVFGESLFNDGMTVVVYNTMTSFMEMPEATGWHYVLAIIAFIVVVFGGLIIGVIFGCITALVTKSTADVRVVEPLALLGLSYLSYLTAELFHFSGIISLIMCGLIQAHYACQNISQKSYTCVKYFTKMASATSETVIFMFLGMVLVSDDHLWHTGFVLWSAFLCFIYRFLGVFVLTGIMNQHRVKKVGLEEQFIAAYGGLRGAVAFSLASTLSDTVPSRRIFITATLAVILSTIFIQGTTIKPLVDLLHIRKHNTRKKKLTEEINDTTMDHIMAGVEEILGQHGDFYLRELLVYYNDRYLRKWFLRSTRETKLTRLFEKIAISEHYAHLYGPVAMIEDHVKPFSPPLPATLPPTQREQVLSHPQFPLNKDTYEKVEDVIAESPGSGIEMRKKYSVIPMRQGRVGSEVISRSASTTNTTNTTTTTTTTQQDATILRKAFKSNPYNKLHYTHNPNLVGEEDQELEEHLNRRRLNARRFTHLASSTRPPRASTTTRPRTISEGGGGGGGGGGSSSSSSRNSDDDIYLPLGVKELLSRHNHRRQSMMQLRANSQGPRRPIQGYFSSPEPGNWSPVSPGILRALQAISESKAVPPNPSEAEVTETTSPPPPPQAKETTEVKIGGGGGNGGGGGKGNGERDDSSSPWLWNGGGGRERNTEEEEEEAVPLVNICQGRGGGEGGGGGGGGGRGGSEPHIRDKLL